MKAVSILSLVSLVLVTTACGKVGKSARSSVKNDPHVQHKLEDCPKIDATYVSGNKTKTLKTQKQDNKSVWLVDSGSVWVLDGGYHGDNKQPFRYKGACQNGAITVYLFNTNHQQLGTLKYVWNGVEKVEISATYRDARVGQNSKDVWTQKAN